MSTRVVNVKLGEPFDIYIGRTMKKGYYGQQTPYVNHGWGNPIRAGVNGVSARDALQHYRVYLLDHPKLLARLGELRDKTLGCWCAPAGGLAGNIGGHTCHGEILAALADDATPEATLRQYVRMYAPLPASINGGKSASRPVGRRRGTFDEHEHIWRPWAADPRFEHCVCGTSRRVASAEEAADVADAVMNDLATLIERAKLVDNAADPFDPLAVRCTHCGAAPGEPCSGPYGIIHSKRSANARHRGDRLIAQRVAAESEVTHVS